MNITKHARERYVERVKGITTKNEIRQYIVENEEMLDNHILKLFEHSDKIYTGQVGGDKTTKDFYITNDICIVADSECIRTIFIINFAFPEKTKMVVIEDLKEEIMRLQSDIEIEKEESDKERDKLNHSIEKLKQDIANYEELIDIRQSEIRMYETQKQVLNKKTQQSYRYLNNYADQLFGNTEYKKDLLMK